MPSEITHGRPSRSSQPRDESSLPSSSPHIRSHSHQGRKSKPVQQHQSPKKNSPHNTTVPKGTDATPSDFDWTRYQVTCASADHEFRRICKDYKTSSDGATLETFGGSEAILREKLKDYKGFKTSLTSALNPTDSKVKAYNNVVATLEKVLAETKRERTIKYLNQLESDSGRLMFQF